MFPLVDFYFLCQWLDDITPKECSMEVRGVEKEPQNCNGAEGRQTML